MAPAAARSTNGGARGGVPEGPGSREQVVSSNLKKLNLPNAHAKSKSMLAV